jgi:hypothetical protein
MGYNPNTGLFDENHNGKADDWRPKIGADSSYNWITENVKPLNSPGVYLESWGNDVNNDRIFWHPTDPNYPDNGKIIWTDSDDLLSRAFLVDEEGFITDPGVTQDFLQGAPPIVNLIDMLAWFSKIGILDTKTLFKWLEGKLPYDNYLFQNPLNRAYGVVKPYDAYDHGIGLQKTWNVLQNGTFNSTGYYNWMETKKKVDVFKLMYELNNWPSISAGTGSPDPMSIFYYMQNPNSYMQADGAIGYIYHPGIGGFNAALSKDNFWKFLNGSWWYDITEDDSYWNTEDPWNTLPGRLFNYLYELEMQQYQSGLRGKNLTYNFFQMLINMGVLPDDFINELQSRDQKPFELLAIYPQTNMTYQLEQAKNKKTKFTINGTFRISVYNYQLYDINHDYKLTYLIPTSDYTVDTHLKNFFIPSKYYSGAGTYSYHA